MNLARIKDNFLFGLNYGQIAVDDYDDEAVESDSSVSYVTLTFDYIFMKNSKFRPFIGYAIGEANMDYSFELNLEYTKNFDLKSSEFAHGPRIGFLYDLNNKVDIGLMFQYLFVDLEDDDIVHGYYYGSEYEIYMKGKHEDLKTTTLFLRYHF